MGRYMGTFVNADLFLHVSSMRNLHDSKPFLNLKSFFIVTIVNMDEKGIEYTKVIHIVQSA